VLGRSDSATLGGPTDRHGCEGFLGKKALCFDANDGDAYGCRNLLGGVVVGTFSMLGLRVKTLDHFGLDDGGVLRRYPFGGVVVEFR
jgi:hypothetical protein